MKTGVSIYLGEGAEKCERVLARAAEAGARQAFTSLHLPEEGADYAQTARRVLAAAHDLGIPLMVDVGPETFAKLGCTSLEQLADLGITHVRLDYGFSLEDTVALSQTFHVVCNASTVTRAEVRAWRAAGADLTRFTACHNFYPKRFTGLALDDVRRRNDWLADQGLETMAFVPGDAQLRGPLHEGLPTVEAHRDRRDQMARNALELAVSAGCDVVLVGDMGLSEKGWGQLRQLSEGYADVRCDLAPGYERLYGQVHHDRPDASPLVFRSVESRGELRPKGGVAPDGTAGQPRPAGAIALSNAGHARYEGELEISRHDLPGDARMNVVGHVVPEDVPLLALVRAGFGLRLIPR